MLDIKDTLAGMFGSVCLVYAGLPPDTVKLRMQTPGSNYNGIIDCFRTMIRQEGVRSLWKGAYPALSSAMIENAVVFSANGFFRRLFSGGDEASLTLLQHTMIGGCSGFFSATAICPAEVVKCRLQYQRSGTGAGASSLMYRGPWACFLDIAKREGFRGCFSGWTPLVARDIPFNSIFFGSYNTYCYLFAKFRGKVFVFQSFEARAPVWVLSTGLESKDELSGLEYFLSGGFAGMTAWTFVFPCDVVKSRMQVAGMLEPGTRASMTNTVKSLVKEHGIRGFYRGWSAAVLRGFPANASLFAGYELSHKLLDALF